MPIFPFPVNDEIRSRNLGTVFEISLSFPSLQSKFSIRPYRFFPPQYLPNASISLHCLPCQLSLPHMPPGQLHWLIIYVGSHLLHAILHALPGVSPICVCGYYGDSGCPGPSDSQFSVHGIVSSPAVQRSSLVLTVFIFSLYPPSPLFSSLILFIPVDRYTCKKYEVVSA